MNNNQWSELIEEKRDEIYDFAMEQLSNPEEGWETTVFLVENGDVIGHTRPRGDNSHPAGDDWIQIMRIDQGCYEDSCEFSCGSEECEECEINLSSQVLERIDCIIEELSYEQ